MRTHIQNLPIAVSANDLEKYPQFAELLKLISKKMDQNGRSFVMQKKFDLAEHGMRKAREVWLHNKLIYHEAGELLADQEVRGQSKSLSIDEQQLRNVFSKALSFSELEDHLTFHTNPATASTLFGLTEADIARHHPIKQHLPALQQTVMPMIEERLKKKCEKLHQFYVTSEDDASDQLLLAKALNLPALVEERQKAVKSEKEALVKDKLHREELLWHHYEKLLEVLSIMQSLIQDFQMSSQSKMDETNVRWFRDRCQAFFLKVRVLQLQIKCHLYTTETVQALQKILSHLDSKIKQTDRDLHSTSRSLEGYHSIGAGFKSLVEDFTQIQQEINNKKWGLEKLAATSTR